MENNEQKQGGSGDGPRNNTFDVADQIPFIPPPIRISNSYPAGNTANITKLNGQNFENWREEIEIVLKLRGLGRTLETDDVQEEATLQARLILIETMDDSHRSQLRGYKSVKQMMERLALAYADKSASNKFRLLIEYFRYQKEPNDSMTEYLGKMHNKRLGLKAINQEPTDEVHMIALIAALPSEYRCILEAWEVTHPDLQKLPVLESRLIKREQALREESGDRALAVRPNKVERTWVPIEERKKATKCNKCGIRGHWARECPKNYGTKEVEIAKTNYLFNVGDLKIGLKYSWIADSGASAHMCNEASWFEELTMLDEPRTCSVGDGRPISVLGQGTVRVSSKVHRKKNLILLTNVLYIPSLATNLVSIGACAKQGVISVFSEKGVSLKKKGEVLVLGNKLTDQLFMLDMKAVKESAPSAMVINNKRSREEWHAALGHPNEKFLDKLLKGNTTELKVKPGEERECGVCPMGKGVRANHPSKCQREIDQVGEATAVDLSGKVNKASLNGAQYYMLFKDIYSEYIYCSFCRDKSEVGEKLAKTIVLFENESGEAIRELHSDNGSEFVNEQVNLLLLKENIKHVTSASYTPQQNGVIEREMRTISGMARTMLLGSNLSLLLWEEAIRTACYLKNRLPTSKSDKSPYERLKGKKPFLAHVIKFGTEAHVIRNWTYLHKFDPRTEEGFIVGYTGRRNTYRVYLPQSNKVIETCDVIIKPHMKTEANCKASNDIGPVGINIDDVNVRSERVGSSGISSQNLGNLSGAVTAKARERILEEALEMENSFIGSPQPQLCDDVMQAREKKTISGKILDEFFEQFRRLGHVETDPEGHDNLEDPPNMTTETPSERREQISNSGDRMDDPPNLIIETPLKRREQMSNSDDRVDDPPSLTIETPLKRREQMSNSDDRVDDPPSLTIETPLKRREQMSNSDDRVNEPPNLTIETPLERREQTNKSSENVEHLVNTLKLFAVADINEPATYEQATNGQNKNEWKRAIEDELAAHADNQTWTITTRPRTGTTLSAKWVFKIKRNAAGNIERYKARLVAKGYEQRFGVDYHDTFAPVAKAESFRIMLALAARDSLVIKQFDVSTAFLYGKLEEAIYLEIPEGIEAKENECLRLDKALYGLKQAPKCWHSTFHDTITSLNFEQLKTDQCVYQNKQKEVILLLYVDDGIVISRRDETAEEVISELSRHFKIKTLSGEMFLGMEISRSEVGIYLGQQRYISEVLDRFGMGDSKPLSTPLADTRELFDQNLEPKFFDQYQEMIGSLLYIATNTRPDILYPTVLLARFCHRQTNVHLTALKRVLRYLRGTADKGLFFKAKLDTDLAFYSDADWAQDADGRVSTSGAIGFFNQSPVVFLSRKQSTVALSSCEAEYVAACEAVKEIEWVTNFLDELDIKHSTPTLFVDNQSTIKQITNGDIKRRAKHVELRYHFVRDKFKSRRFNLKYVESQNQIADYLTKGVDRNKLEKFRTMSKIINPKIMLALVFLLAISASCQELKLERTSSVVMLPDGNGRVEIGEYFYDIDYVLESPCPSLKKAAGDLKDRPIARKVFEELERECELLVEEQWMPQLAILADCAPDIDDAKVDLFRGKRFVWFIPFIVSLVVSSGISTAINSYGDDKDRLDAIEQRERVRDQEVETLKKIVKEQNEKFNNGTVQMIQDLSKQLQETRRNVTEIIDVLPHVSIASSKFIYRINRHTEYLKAINDMCSKRKVATREMAEIISDESLRLIDPEDTHWIRVTREKGVFNFKFSAIKKAKNCTLYKVKGLTTHGNMANPESLYFKVYAGPTMALYNATSNCTKGVEPTDGKVFDNCLAQNYYDPALQFFVLNKVKPTEEVFLPQVIRGTTKNFIYCAYGNATIGNQTFLCPPAPFVLPNKVSFFTGNHSYVAEEIIIKSRMPVERYSSGKLGPILVDDISENNMKAIINLHRSNAVISNHTKELDTLSNIKERLNNMSTDDLLLYSTVFTLFLSIVTILLQCCTRRGGEVVNETVNNNIEIPDHHKEASDQPPSQQVQTAVQSNSTLSPNEIAKEIYKRQMEYCMKMPNSAV